MHGKRKEHEVIGQMISAGDQERYSETGGRSNDAADNEINQYKNQYKKQYKNENKNENKNESDYGINSEKNNGKASESMDRQKIMEGVRLILEGIGEDPGREGLRETPERIARMYQEIFGGMEQSAAQPLSRTFHAENTDMVLEKDITFYSTCEHHLLPFYGKAHIAYIPQEKIAGLSKLARVVEVFAKRLQLQERLTAQIADAMMEYLCPKGVMVMLEAEHMCMTMRGIKKPGSRTVTFASRGVFAAEPALQNRFIQMVK